KKIYYYRCLGSDDYRYEGGRVCANKPVRADYLDAVVWDHITAMLVDPVYEERRNANRLWWTQRPSLGGHNVVPVCKLGVVDGCPVGCEATSRRAVR
ncbi:MAG TPA: zinc ribbon domain-containing protein, partial [Mycobacterium sp.]|nr:zinc ribbon domain-containing protein [Mycobacterium sp.]